MYLPPQTNQDGSTNEKRYPDSPRYTPNRNRTVALHGIRTDAVVRLRRDSVPLRATFSQCYMLDMDLVYMTDVMAYQSIRGPVYDKYSYDLQTNNEQSKNQRAQKKNKDKEPCKICQERQRRSLMKYIRSKSHEHSDKEIKEEEEEEDEAQEKPTQEKQEAKKR